jgi:hypothetical protein
MNAIRQHRPAFFEGFPDPKTVEFNTAQDLGVHLLAAGHLGTPEKMRKFIEGFR